MLKLSERFMTKEQYIKKSGTYCINCGSKAIVGGEIEIEDTHPWRSVRCHDCKYRFIEVFALVDVEPQHE